MEMFLKTRYHFLFETKLNRHKALEQETLFRAFPLYKKINLSF